MMPTRLNTNFPRLTDHEEFESMVRDICAHEWGDPNTSKFGRRGQKQFGVDIYGHPEEKEKNFRGAQCKLRTKGDQLTEGEVDKEVVDARKFPHILDKLIIVTDTSRDSKLQLLIDNINARELGNGGFRVVIWFWEDITERLAAYPKLIVKYYKEIISNITSQTLIESLVDKPLRIVIDASENTNRLALLKEALHFRGISTIEKIEKQFSSQSYEHDYEMVDGIICYYQPDENVNEEEKLTKFVSKILGYVHHNKENCPIFVVVRSSVPVFLEIAQNLELSLQEVIIVEEDQPSNELADKVFNIVFPYGYSRRGGLSTIEITARTNQNKPGSALLDIDWCSRLSIDKFPTMDEWKEFFFPALETVRNQILNQGDVTRIHINSQLPVPAAIALGFYFNIRVARVGVWVRKSNTSDFKQQFWLSNSSPADIGYRPEWIQHMTNDNPSAIVELTTYVPIHNSVRLFVKQQLGIGYCTWVKLALEVDGEKPENIEEAQAIAFAKQVGQLARLLNNKGITDIHLFCRIPSALAILIGQRLQSCGRIHLYWFDNPSYRFAFTLS